MTRFPVQFSDGKVYEIGGIPLCSRERLREVAPELAAAIEKDGDTNEELAEQVFQIVRFFNPEVEREDFITDVYATREVFKIWIGQANEPKKKGD